MFCHSVFRTAVWTILACLALGHPALADTNVLETFDDRDAEDGMPVTWVPQLGNWDASNGDYVASHPTLFARISLAPEFSSLSDTSVRARVRAEGNTWLGVGVRRSPGPFGYAAGIFPDGELNIIRVDGAPVAIELVDTVVPFNAADQDVMLQMDAIGDELSVWAWPEGDPMPDAPQLVVSDSTYATGTVGLISAVEDDPPTANGIFRHVHVADMHIPEPSTMTLMGVGVAALLAYARRRRFYLH